MSMDTEETVIGGKGFTPQATCDLVYVVSQLLVRYPVVGLVCGASPFPLISVSSITIDIGIC
jgi:hypothetical protein